MTKPNVRRRPHAVRWLLGGSLAFMAALIGSLGFSYYRSEVGPNPCFVLILAEEIDVQEVKINGRRTSGASTPRGHFVHFSMRPADAVHLQIWTDDGRMYESKFAELGHHPRTIWLDDQNLISAERGVLILRFDAHMPLKAVSVQDDRRLIVYDSPFQHSLPAGKQRVVVEWEDAGVVRTTTQEIVIRQGQKLELTLQEFLEGTRMSAQDSTASEAAEQSTPTTLGEPTLTH